MSDFVGGIFRCRGPTQIAEVVIGRVAVVMGALVLFGRRRSYKRHQDFAMSGDGYGFPAHADMIDAVAAASFLDVAFEDSPGHFVVLVDEQLHVSCLGNLVIGDGGFSPFHHFSSSWVGQYPRRYTSVLRAWLLTEVIFLYFPVPVIVPRLSAPEISPPHAL